MAAHNLPTYKDDIKTATVSDEKTGEMLISAPPRRSRPLAAGFAAVAVCYLLYKSMFSMQPLFFGCHQKAPATSWHHEIGQSTNKLVPFEAHIMSKCPDAKDCLMEMVLPTMQRVFDKVNFTLSYIGTPTDNDGVSCMHGPEECMGNIIELCAADLYPDPKIYLGFTMCLTRDYQDIPQHNLMADCALEHGMDLAKLDECAVKDDGGFGIGMLRDSVRRSTDAGITKSCTVRVNEETYCIRDGGKWKDCPNGSGVNDLVIAIEKLHRS